MFLFIDEFTVQIFHIYKDVERIQKGMREDQIKLKLNVFNFDLIIIKSYNFIYSPTISDHNYMENIFSNSTYV